MAIMIQSSITTSKQKIKQRTQQSFRPLITWISFFTASCIFLGTVAPANARRERNVPHHHKGVLSQYKPGPFDVLQIGKKDESILENGKPLMKQIPSEDGASGGRAICVQDVKAPKDAVWNQILDLDNYVGKVPKLKECKNYLIKSRPDGSMQIKTKMVVGVMPGYKYEYYCDHSYSPENDSVTWSLDYDKSSDFDDVAGHWHVEEHPTKKGSSRVFYACDIKFKTAVPGPIMSFVSKSALKSATGWVKKESEGSPDSPIPLQFQTATAQ